MRISAWVVALSLVYAASPLSLAAPPSPAPSASLNPSSDACGRDRAQAQLLQDQVDELKRELGSERDAQKRTKLKRQLQFLHLSLQGAYAKVRHCPKTETPEPHGSGVPH